MRELLQRLAARLRAVGFAPALGFGALAIVADELEHLPRDLHTLATQGARCALMRERLHHMGGEAALVLVVLVTLMALARSRADLLARPARSLAQLLGAASLGLVAMSAVEAAWAGPPPGGYRLATLPWWPMIEAWATLAMWGVLWGTLFLQHLRQREADRHLALVLGRRAALARQVLEAQLRRARAQVDPAAIVRVLRAVRERADSNGAATAAVPLIDHLAGYLRLLLQRVRTRAPSVTADVELLRALVALHRAESGREIELVVDDTVPACAHRAAGASFLVARLMLDTALADRDGGGGLRLTLAAAHDAIQIEASWRTAAPIESDAAITAALQHLQPELRFDDRHDNSGRTLVAHVPLQ